MSFSAIKNQGIETNANKISPYKKSFTRIYFRSKRKPKHPYQNGEITKIIAIGPLDSTACYNPK